MTPRARCDIPTSSRLAEGMAMNEAPRKAPVSRLVLSLALVLGLAASAAAQAKTAQQSTIL